jgi:hypothetical protein
MRFPQLGMLPPGAPRAHGRVVSDAHRSTTWAARPFWVRATGDVCRLEESVRGYCEHLRQAGPQQGTEVAPRADIAGEPLAPP